METSTIITAAIGAVAGVLGGAISPVINLIQHIRAERKADRDRKRAQIAAWRRMLFEVNGIAAGSIDVGPIIQLNHEYLSLEPYLSEDTKAFVYGENRTFVVGSKFALPLNKLKAEIDRIEALWRLRD